MYIKCWQCFQELDTISIEKQVYRNVIDELRKFLCENSIDDNCDFVRHEDCRAVSVLINIFKERI